MLSYHYYLNEHTFGQTGKNIKPINTQRHQHDWCQPGKLSILVPPDVPNMHSLADYVLRFLCKIFSKWAIPYQILHGMTPLPLKISSFFAPFVGIIQIWKLWKFQLLTAGGSWDITIWKFGQNTLSGPKSAIFDLPFL